MKRVFEKFDLLIAILFIVVYCGFTVPIRGKLGDESPAMLGVLAAIAVVIFVLVKVTHTEERYGFVKWKGKASDYWFFIPMLILMTGNLWGGFGIAYDGINQVYAVLSMMLIGFIEELIFRGFLFRALLKRDPAPVAIIITAVTFGIGHIINFFAGQASLETVIQVFFAIAWGFIFTFVFYKSGNLVMCIIVHGMVDAFSKFDTAERNIVTEYAYVFATIGIAIIYCLYLSRKQTALTKE